MTTTTPTRITDEQEQDAMRVLRSSYWESVRDIAQDIATDHLAEAYANDDDRTDDLSERIAESVDNSQWVIYTWRALLVRSLSNHADAYEEYGMFGNHTERDNLDSIITHAADIAMYNDVREVLDSILSAADAAANAAAAADAAANAAAAAWAAAYDAFRAASDDDAAAAHVALDAARSAYDAAARAALALAAK